MIFILAVTRTSLPRNRLKSVQCNGIGKAFHVFSLLRWKKKKKERVLVNYPNGI